MTLTLGEDLIPRFCYGAADPLPGDSPSRQKRSTKIRLQLASLKATLVADPTAGAFGAASK